MKIFTSSFLSSSETIQPYSLPGLIIRFMLIDMQVNLAHAMLGQ
jgi:hypothetical protein